VRAFSPPQAFDQVPKLLDFQKLECCTLSFFSSASWRILPPPPRYATLFAFFPEQHLRMNTFPQSGQFEELSTVLRFRGTPWRGEEVCFLSERQPPFPRVSPPFFLCFFHSRWTAGSLVLWLPEPSEFPLPCLDRVHPPLMQSPLGSIEAGPAPPREAALFFLTVLCYRPAKIYMFLKIVSLPSSCDYQQLFIVIFSRLIHIIEDPSSAGSVPPVLTVTPFYGRRRCTIAIDLKV